MNNIVLTLLGLGLIFVSVAAFRNVNKTPSDAVDRAFLNAMEKMTSRLLKLVFLPLDFLIACKDALVSIVMFPFKMISSGVSRAGTLGKNLVGFVQEWLLWLLHLPTQFLSSLLSGAKHAFDITYTNMSDRFSSILSRAVEMSSLGGLFQKIGHRLSCALNVTKIRWIVLNKNVSDNIYCVEDFATRMLQEFFEVSNRALDELATLQNDVAKFTIAWKLEGKAFFATVSKGYQSLNEKLTHLAVSTEAWLRRIAGIF